ncbi:hypothetical protein GGS24DRAFT_496702 [Hypoxylon argillaceum]|nr:hypothetical protein GGS24DRAFT_496702 [Hypoxylon argillaceum]KAI1145828.1 hypothetical protein F4825DRAFT_473441 [Nemania diffusa]
MAHGKKSEKKGKEKPSITDTLKQISSDVRALERKLADLNAAIPSLQAKCRANASSKASRRKSAAKELGSAYDKQSKLQNLIDSKLAQYKAIQAELDDSSDGSQSSLFSEGISSASSSISSSPAYLGWDCGCGQPNFTDPWGFDNWCICGHQYCDDEMHCSIQWNPTA